MTVVADREDTSTLPSPAPTPQRERRPLVRLTGFWLIASLALCLVSAIGASLVQTDGGRVAVTDLRWETASGRSMSALLFRPQTATADRPAPAVVVSHGWYNTREMQDANYVELARRGYVVLSIDMYGHGNSDALPTGQEMVGGTGMYDAVQLVADLPYVDRGKIGVTGHSNGARAANYSVAIDNQAAQPLISSVFLVDNDAAYLDTATKAYANVYGSRDVGVNADQYDEFFFRSYDADKKPLTPPRAYIGTPNAQSFLHFGVDPTTVGGDVRAAGTPYTQTVDGTDAQRVVYTPYETHPWGPFSKTTTGNVITFFDSTLGAPDPIAASSQIWQWKELFNALGVVGFGIFLVALTKSLVRTRAFAALRRPLRPTTQGRTRGELVSFWVALTVSAAFSAWSYVWFTTRVTTLKPSFLPQSPPWFIGTWAAANGLFTLLVLGVTGVIARRRNGRPGSGAARLDGRVLAQSIGLAVVVAAAAFGLVFLADYFFKTDFRLWVLAIKAFTPDKIGISLMYLPLFAVYFIANSVAINAFNRFALAGREWVNTAVLALFNALPAVVLLVWQYVTFFVTGNLLPWFGGIYSIWLFPVVVILAVSAVVSRKIYRATSNPYLGGLLMAIVVAVVSCTNTLTMA